MLNAVTDYVFESENDLVVDSSSMFSFSENGPTLDTARILDFGSTSRVHHVNYFEQPETVAHIRAQLTI
jgi:hypothetical protein